MEKKTVTRLDGTKETVKAAESAVKAEETVKAAVKENAAAKDSKTTTVVEKAAKAAAEETKKAVEETRAVVETAKKTVKEAAKAKKTTRTAKKTEKEPLVPEVYIQYQGREAIVAEAVEKAKAEFVADGHRVSSVKSLQVYLKPEENAAYYVINQKFAGRVDLF